MRPADGVCTSAPLSGTLLSLYVGGFSVRLTLAISVIYPGVLGTVININYTLR